MIKRITGAMIAAVLFLNISGCFALFAGAVGGAGTAFWLSGKLTQQFNVSYDRAVVATKSALKSLNLEIIKEAKEVNVTTFRSYYSDGKEVWVDVKRVTDASTMVEVRVGGVAPDKEACDKILNRIKNYL